jgi:heat shock protein HtpX
MWEQIRSNHIRSVVLVAAMGLLLLAIGYVLGIYFFDNVVAGMLLALVIWGIMNLIAYFQGDSILLSMSRARKIKREDHPRLYNIVEEMKIASGLSRMPDIYIIDDPAMNAFATGRDIEHSSVAITSGLLSRLNRDELQGVIGHEIAHINNRDVLLMSFLTVMLGTIVILSWYASRMLLFSGMAGGRNRRSSSGGGQAQLIIMLVGLVLMILAPIFAQFIYFAVSRRREYLADASSALYTRYPEGLASALEKLAQGNTKVKAANKATASMYISNPFLKAGRAANSLSATHPPLAERIRILRAMGGASYANYSEAYSKIHRGGGHIISPATAGIAGIVGIRQAQPEKSGEENLLERTRATQDLMWHLNDYKMVDCECGTRLKVPAKFSGKTVRCPRCGREHRIPE